MSLYNINPINPINTAAAATDGATDIATAPTVAPKILLQITESKSINPFSGNKNPSYNVNVLSYYDGTELQNSTDKSDVEKLLTDTKNNILLIENNKPPVEVKDINKISSHVFRKVEQQPEPTSTNNFNTPSLKDKILGTFGKSEKVAVTVNGGKTKRKRKRSTNSSYKKSSQKRSYRRKLTRRS